MRLPIIASLVLLSAPAAALAATPPVQHFTAAPVPSIMGPAPQPGYGVAPPGMQSDDAGPVDSTPFSAWGSGSLRWGGSEQLGPHTREADLGGLVTTPNMQR